MFHVSVLFCLNGVLGLPLLRIPDPVTPSHFARIDERDVQNLTRQQVRLAHSIIEGIRSAEKDAFVHLEFGQQPQKQVFCYFFVRSPAEPTASLLLDQLSRGCDGYAAFSNKHQTLHKHYEVHEAFTDEDLEDDWNHQMHFMMMKAWKMMAGLGNLGKYKWYVKFDSDSFVQSSIVRKTFSRYSADNVIISTGRLSSTSVDGFLVALPNSFLQKVYELMQRKDKNERVCDEFVSGHDESIEEEDPTSYEECAQEVGKFSVQYPEDENGNVLLLGDEEGRTAKNNGCGRIAVKVLRHFKKTSTPLCDCKPFDAERTKCYSHEFLTVHPVKHPHIYRKLMQNFP